MNTEKHVIYVPTEIQLALLFKQAGVPKLRTQRLMYLAQGLHYMMFGSGCFGAPIRLLRTGPRVQNVWEEWFEMEHKYTLQNADSDLCELAAHMTQVFQTFSNQELHDLIEQHIHNFKGWKFVPEHLMEDVFTNFYHGPKLEKYFHNLNEEARLMFEDFRRKHPEKCSDVPHTLKLY